MSTSRTDRQGDVGGLGPRPVSELLDRASLREPVYPGDGRSGSVFERVTIDGQRFFLKRLSPASDWIMRVTGDQVHRPFLVWQAGIMDRAPACIDHTVIAMEIAGAGEEAVLSMLMRDVGVHLVPEGDAVLLPAQHEGFVEHLAQLSASFWGWQDSVGGLSTMEERVRFFAPDNIAAELTVPSVPGPIAAADAGWRALAERSPYLFRVATAIHAAPELVTGPLAE